MRLIALTILVTCSALSGCDRPAATATRSTTRPVADESLRVLHDRRDATYEWVFIVRGGNVFAQRHVFPGYADPVIRVVGSLDPKTASRLAPVLTHAGDVKPPFPPHGPYFSRTDVGTTAARSITVFFANDNQMVSAALADLQAAVIRDGTPVTEPPDWVKGSPELLRELGRGP